MNYNWKQHFTTFISSFVGIGFIGFLSSYFKDVGLNLFLIGSFGATALIVFGNPNSEYAQTKNVIGGHLISAIIGVTIAKVCFYDLWLSAALAVSLSITCMMITDTVHPPGGATSLIACLGSPKIIELGYLYVFFPVLSGAIILLLISALFNKKPFIDKSLTKLLFKKQKTLVKSFFRAK